MTLAFALPPERSFHICVDMQRMFLEETDWRTPWMERIVPAVTALSGACPERTVFTRFIPPRVPEEAQGAWADYFRKWPGMTRAALHPDLIGLVPELARLTPPALVLDKPVYSPWLDGRLHKRLRLMGVEILVVTGCETDVCVLATVLGAIDLGYRVVLPTDAVCGSADRTHDDTLDIYRSRFAAQLSACLSEEVLAAWARDPLPRAIS